MDGMFALSSGGEYQTSTQQLEDLLLRCRQENATALIQVLFPPENRLLFPLLTGNLLTVYFTSGQVTKKVSPGEWSHLLGKQVGLTRIISLPVEAIRLCKLMTEMPGPRSTFPLSTADMKARIEQWAGSTQAQLVDCHWEHAKGTLFLPGFGASAYPIVFLNEFQIIVGQDAWFAIASWQENACQVTLIKGDETTAAIREYRLHTAFINIIEHVQKRYNDMVGASLLDNMNHDLSQAASIQDWNIKAGSFRVHDNQVFSSPESACSAYRLLCNLCLTHIETVIGPKYTSMLASEAIERLDSNTRAIVLQYALIRPLRMP